MKYLMISTKAVPPEGTNNAPTTGLPQNPPKAPFFRARISSSNSSVSSISCCLAWASVEIAPALS